MAAEPAPEEEMRKVVKGLVALGALSILAVASVAVALPVLGEMKIKLFEDEMEVVYDSNPNTIGDSALLHFDGVADVVTAFSDVEFRSSTGSYFFDTFDQGDEGAEVILQLDATAFDGSTGVYNMLYTSNGNKIAFASLGAGQTLSPDMTATGLDISGDQTDDEGYEYILGLFGASGRVFVIGQDPAFYTCATINVPDVSGTDEMHVGFRRAGLVNGTYDNYTDLASIGLNNGAIYIETIDDNAATTSTDTTDTWADTATKTLCVFVSAAGVVTYTINGAAPTTTAAFTIDDADPVIPFIYLLHSSDLAGAVELRDWTVGYQSGRGISQ